MKRLFLLIIFICSNLSAQIIGKVTDTSGEPLPFVNIYIKDTYIGTTSNDDGLFSLPAKEKREYVISFQYLGYETVSEKIQPENFPTYLQVQLKETSTSLKEVIITNQEDPAYAIIRNTIAQRRENLERVDAFTADFYSKGLWKIKNAPEKILGQDLDDLEGLIDSTRTGIIYLSETVSTITYKKPDHFKERIIASKVSGNDNGFSFNSAQAANISFYENTYNFNAPLVSPIGANALNYYNYELEGVFYDSNKLINKIAVKPRRENDRVWKGIIYIVEDDWQLYGVDLYTTGEALQVPLVKELRVTQSFKYDETQNFWIKISQSLFADAGALGFNIEGRFLATYSNYDFTPHLSKRFFTNEVLSFEPEANKKDSLFWNTIRPIPLTLDELKDYKKRDSMAQLRKSKPYLDSLDRKENKFKFFDVLGYTYTDSYRQREVGIKTPLTRIRFNTVQGWNVQSGLFFKKWYNENQTNSFSADLDGSYSLSEDRFRFTGKISRQFNMRDRLRFSLSGGSKVEQFLPGAIPAVFNTITTLYFQRNNMKLYEMNFVKLDYGQEILNGVELEASVAYEERNPLFNNTYYVTFHRRDVGYSSNNPLAPEDFLNPAFYSHEVLKSTLNAEINFGQKYFSNPDLKFKIKNNKYPTLLLSVVNGIGLNEKKYDFTRLEMGLKQTLSMGNKGRSDYYLSGGSFVQGDAIAFVDFKHFQGNQTRVATTTPYTYGFNLLPYYEFSTNKSYFEGHYEHNFKGYVLGKIPGLNRLNWNLVLGAHYLSTEDYKPYSEISVGIDNLGFGNFRFLRLDYVHAFHNGEQMGAFIFGLKFLSGIIK